MPESSRALASKVVVVTGASSGIGRATALELARGGASVVCAARRERAIQDVASACVALGGSALAVPTDVTIPSDVAALAQAAVAHFGRIDAWVNAAGVTYFAPLSEGDFDEHRRVIETNVLGSMWGSRAAIRAFRERGEGVLVNVGSILSKIGQPFVPSYAISKFAVRGLSESLSIELADEPAIHVCTVYPYAIDTPHFELGGNDVGRPAHAMPPVLTPERVAHEIVGLVLRPRREVHVPSMARAALALHALFPRTVDRLILHVLRRWHFDASLEAPRDGNLYAPTDDGGSVHGTRGPRVGLGTLLAWSFGDLVRSELRSMTHAEVTHPHAHAPRPRPEGIET